MKSKSIGSLILLAILAPSCGGSGGKNVPPKLPNFAKWQTQQRVPTSSDLRSVIFADLIRGIVAGKDGTFFRTDDGGQTWSQMEIAPPDRTGTVAQMSANGFTLVAVGTDGANGRSWTGTHDSVSWLTSSAAATGPAYVDVNVSDAGSGNVGGTYWMLRDDGVIDYMFQSSAGTFTTVNASPAQPPCPQPPILPVTWTKAMGVVFLGLTGTGMVCGISGSYGGNPGCPDPVDPVNNPPLVPPVPAHGPVGQVIMTTDFGSTWKVQDMTPPTISVSAVRRMYITSTAGGVMRTYAIADDMGTPAHGTLIVTNLDIQDRWDVVGNVPAGLPTLRALSFPVNDQTGWVVGDNGTIYKITATAVFTPGTPGDPHAHPPIPPTPGFWTYTYTWTPQASGVGAGWTLWSIAMIDNNNGYIVGDKGLVLKMTAGGPWTRIDRGDPGIAFNAASFTDDGQKGIAVGDSGKIYRTTDGGKNWSSMSSGTGQNLLGASVPRLGAGTTAYACGAGGTILKNADVWAGGAWNPMAGTTGGDTYRSITFPLDELRGVCVGTTGAGSRLLHTTDGATWGAPNPGPAPTLPSVSYYGLAFNPGVTTVYAAGGANGLVSTSADFANGWDAWADLSPSPGGALTLFSIAAPEGAIFRAFAAASDNKVWRMTTATPQTWGSTANPWGAQNPVSLAFQNNLEGLTVIADGQVWYTVDGAGTWGRSYPHTKDKPRAIWMSPTVWGLGYVVADDGTILKTTTFGR